MTRKEKKQEEWRVRGILECFFGEAYREADFCYYRGKKAVLVTYQDFKPESEIKDEVREILGGDWKVVLKREYSDLTVMLTMLKLFKENRVAIVDIIDDELRPFTIREYVWRKMEGR